MSAFDTKLKNVGLMKAECGYDVIIVCTSDEYQAAFWEALLESAKGRAIPTSSTPVAVDEDWPGGAGNFFGTLYAWKKACDKLQAKGKDLAKMLEEGASVALFHTAGKGTRMAPLPGSENNNKPGVKLPVPGAASILECVIRQTGAYASSRKKRLSVFWGDQIFVPSVAAEYTAEYHADILCGLGPLPSAEEWTARGLEKYGLIAGRTDNSVALMLEKVSHSTATEQLAGLAGVDCVGTSLGSFSLSAPFLTKLMEGFSAELAAKQGKMDSDPHLWMTVTLGKAAYADLMVKKGLFDKAGAEAHHDRVSAILASFDVSAGGFKGLFGTVNTGLDMSWWDYGLLRLYVENSLLLTKDSEEAKLARAFFGIDDAKRIDSATSLGACSCDEASVVSNTKVTSGSIASSSVLNVCAQNINADGALLVNVTAKKIKAVKGAIAYNIVDDTEDGISLNENEVRVGVFTTKADTPYFEMKSNIAEVDGGKAFKEKVCGNDKSFQDVYDLNCGMDVTACARESEKRHSSLRSAQS
eukprot:TRINITY_DN10705_c0_g1_i2.p1 TRINITY_DN10705_c0_g1~~TRINITY_DN10705_c0_g1_i2.p1  ORF type:complete len:527 (-),score=150.27 TRINITY_DN10705_c0_g1_i2:226-1806(-)